MGVENGSIYEIFPEKVRSFAVSGRRGVHSLFGRRIPKRGSVHAGRAEGVLDGTGSFMGVDNPYWTKASIKMNDYYAHKLMRDQSECGIDSDIIKNATDKFCEAAGVLIWEQF